MPTTKKYRKKILEAALELGTSVPDPASIDFRMLAKHLKIRASQIQSEFLNMSHIFHEITMQRFQEHEEKSKKIAKLTGGYALSTLLKHDLSMLFYYARDSKKMANIEQGNESIAYAREYIEKKMPLYYFDVLRFNPDLLPNKDINAKLYSQFLVHSMFFFTKDELSTMSPNSRELTAITRKLIISLFSTTKEKIKID